MEKWLNLIRGLVRPLVTFALVGALIYLVIRITLAFRVPTLPSEVYVGIISSFLTAVALVLGFWFGARNNRPPSA